MMKDDIFATNCHCHLIALKVKGHVQSVRTRQNVCRDILEKNPIPTDKNHGAESASHQAIILSGISPSCAPISLRRSILRSKGDNSSLQREERKWRIIYGL